MTSKDPASSAGRVSAPALPIPVGLALRLIATVRTPGKVGVFDLRRLCRYRGIRSWNGKRVSFLNRAELLAVHEHHGGLPNA